MLKNIMKFVPLGTSQFGPLNFEELALFIKRTKQEKEMVVYQIQRTSFPKIDILIIYIRLQSGHIKCFCSS